MVYLCTLYLLWIVLSSLIQFPTQIISQQFGHIICHLIRKISSNIFSLLGNVITTSGKWVLDSQMAIVLLLKGFLTQPCSGNTLDAIQNNKAFYILLISLIFNRSRRKHNCCLMSGRKTALTLCSLGKISTAFQKTWIWTSHSSAQKSEQGFLA